VRAFRRRLRSGGRLRPRRVLQARAAPHRHLLLGARRAARDLPPAAQRPPRSGAARQPPPAAVAARGGRRPRPRPRRAQGAAAAGPAGERRGAALSLPPRQLTAFLLGPEQLELREVAVAPPAAGEILVRIGAATTCGTDVKVFRRGGHPRMLKV